MLIHSFLFFPFSSLKQVFGSPCLSTLSFSFPSLSTFITSPSPSNSPPSPSLFPPPSLSLQKGKYTKFENTQRKERHCIRKIERKENSKVKEGKGNPKERNLGKDLKQERTQGRKKSLNGKGTEEWRELKSEGALGNGRNLEKKGTSGITT